MNDNTQEKNLIERKENNVFEKIKNFFRNLFGKKEEVNNIVDEDLEMEMEKSIDFRESLKNFEVDNNNIYELKRRYHNDEISEDDLTQEQINQLCQLYDSQIADLKKTIAAKEQMLENYKKGKRAQ